jgi:hypothetical protein
MKTSDFENLINLKCNWSRESRLKARLQCTCGDLHADAIASRGVCADFGERQQIRWPQSNYWRGVWVIVTADVNEELREF